VNDMEALAAAADLLRRNARAAVDHDDERWMVDQTETDGLAVGCYVPEDVLDDGQVCTASVAFFAYPDDQERRTHHRALATAAHMAGLDPAVAVELADWLGGLHADLDRVGGDILACDSPGDVRRAVRLARKYLRQDT
jgi:hypothetical protein